MDTGAKYALGEARVGLPVSYITDMQLFVSMLRVQALGRLNNPAVEFTYSTMVSIESKHL